MKKKIAMLIAIGTIPLAVFYLIGTAVKGMLVMAFEGRKHDHDAINQKLSAVYGKRAEKYRAKMLKHQFNYYYYLAWSKYYAKKIEDL